MFTMQSIWTIFSWCLVASVSAGGQLKLQLNPGCNGTTVCDMNHILVTTRSFPNASFSYMYLWSDVGMPAVSVARTTKPESLKMEWSDEAGEKPVKGIELERDYLQTTLFSRLIAVNTTTYTPGQGHYFVCDLANGMWVLNSTDPERYDQDSVSSTKLELTRFPDGLMDDRCDFSMNLSTSDTEGHEYALPRLKYSENSTRWSLGFSNFNLSRDGEDLSVQVGLSYVLEMIIIPDSKQKELHLSSGRFLDDEYTPSQFWHSQIESGPAPRQGFHYWKPIVYTNSSTRNIKNSVHVELYKDRSTNKDRLLTLQEAHIDLNDSYSLASMLADGNITMEDVRVAYFLFNATTDKDQVFNLVVGIGEVPSDSISLTVILIISLGLGLPALILIFGVPSVTIYRRCSKKKQQGYTQIQ